MTEAGRFQKVRALFDDTAELPGDERLANLRRLTDDESVVQEVLAMCVANDSDSTTQFSKPLGSILQSAAAPTLKAGDTLGVWQIGREIGHGGMGSVYLVERVDGHFTQTAALKFVKGLPRAETLNYFSRERQLLAKLSHPNIARLLDGGATSGGQPYLVMEYVDGVAIDVYCQERRLSAEQVLKLFVEACDSVAFAHRQLIVHCDLKPSNLLINQDGRPMLLDFGIARLLDRVGAQADDAAIGSSVAYTPRYASPEQREHGVVSTASDIFSLGIMLGELLGGAATATPNAELKAILAKACAINAAKRYATVDAFAEDIQHYLRKLPVAAMPPTAAYTAQKFMQRRWPLVLAGAAFAATVLVFTVKVIAEAERATSAEKTALRERDRAQLAEGQAVTERDATQLARNDAMQERDRAAQERDRATAAESAAATGRNSARRAEALAIRERDRATEAETATRQTSDFLISVFDATDPTASTGDIPASSLLAAAERRIADEMRQQPTTQAALFAVIGKVRKNMGSTGKAQENYRQAVELERKNNRSLVLAQVLAESARLDIDAFGGREAEAQAREALALREKFAAADSEPIAESLALLGYVLLFKQAKMAESGELIQRSLAIRERIDPSSFSMSESLHFAGLHAGKLFEYPRAITLLSKSIAIRERLLGAGHPRVMGVQEDLATFYRRSGALSDAEALYQKLLASREKLHGRNSDPTLRLIALLASTLAARENYREAVKLSEEGLAIAEKLNGRESPQYIAILNNFALQESKLGLHAGALAHIQAALQLSRKINTPNSPSVVLTERNLGGLLLRAKQPLAAQAQLLKALEASRKLHGVGHREVALTLVDLSGAEIELGRGAEARKWLGELEAMPKQATAGLVPAMTQLLARTLALESRDEAAFSLFLQAEKLLADIGGRATVDGWLFKVPRLDFMKTRGIDPTARAAASAEVLAKVEPILDPSADVLGHLRSLKTP